MPASGRSVTDDVGGRLLQAAERFRDPFENLRGGGAIDDVVAHVGQDRAGRRVRTRFQLPPQPAFENARQRADRELTASRRRIARARGRPRLRHPHPMTLARWRRPFANRGSGCWRPARRRGRPQPAAHTPRQASLTRAESAWSRILPVPHAAGAKRRLARVARLSRTRVDRGLEANGAWGAGACTLRSALGDQAGRTDGDPAAPKRLGQPIADLGRKTLDVGARKEADAAGRFTVHHHRKECRRTRARHGLDELTGVGERVGMRKTIANWLGDVRIVGVPGERHGIGRPPGPRASRARSEFVGAPSEQRRSVFPSQRSASRKRGHAAST